eukprot:SAG31_NODE_1667_length_7578_cov_4.345233_3_plen_980_part_00
MPSSKVFPLSKVLDEYHLPSMVRKFEYFAQDMGHEPSFGEEKITATGLATLTADLIILNEELYGKDGRQKSAMVKIPARIFRDFTTGGALYKVLRVCYLYKKTRGWTKFDFKAAESTSHLMEMMGNIEAMLKEYGLLERPKCFLSSMLQPEDKQKLEGVLVAKGASVVNSAADATHVLYPDPPGTSRDEADDDWIKVIGHEDRGGRAGCRVHWWYLPESYDEWLPQEEVEGAQDTDSSAAPPRWELHRRWVDDLEVYNEFMAEPDYEIDPQPDNVGMLGTEMQQATGKRGRDCEDADRLRRSTSGDGKGKRQKHDMTDGPVALGQPATAHSSDSDEEDASSAADDNSSMLRKIDPTAFRRGPPGVETATVTLDSSSSLQFSNESDGKIDFDIVPKIKFKVPEAASWYRRGVTDEIERKKLPEFFTSKYPSKTPAVYITYRDAMIDAYRLNPTVTLSLTAVRIMLVGDVGGIFRVWQALQEWGLINYPPNLDVTKAPATVAAAAPDAVSSLYRAVEPSPSSEQKPGDARGSDTWKCPEPTATADADGREDDTTARWTDEEVLALLKAIEEHADDWVEVAKKVPSKTREQCLLKFLRMPIEDEFLADSVDPELANAAEGTPFETANNPLLAQLSFLCNHVHPAVASAAAEAALKKLQVLEARPDPAPETDKNSTLKAPETVMKRQMAAAAAVGLAAAVSRATQITEAEERRVQLLVLEATRLQAEKVELKIRHFREIEQLMEQERLNLERIRKTQQEERLKEAELPKATEPVRPQPTAIELVSMTPVPAQGKGDSSGPPTKLPASNGMADGNKNQMTLAMRQAMMRQQKDAQEAERARLAAERMQHKLRVQADVDAQKRQHQLGIQQPSQPRSSEPPSQHTQQQPQQQQQQQQQQRQQQQRQQQRQQQQQQQRQPQQRRRPIPSMTNPAQKPRDYHDPASGTLWKTAWSDQYSRWCAPVVSTAVLLQIYIGLRSLQVLVEH